MTESQLQLEVCKYLKMRYPDMVFRSDFAAGIKMTPGQAKKHKAMQQDRAYPDLFIAEPVRMHHGLFIELKREGTSVLLKNGQLTANPHIRAQRDTLEFLSIKGYGAAFAIGFDQAKQIIDDYVQGEPIIPLLHQVRAANAKKSAK